MRKYILQLTRLLQEGHSGGNIQAKMKLLKLIYKSVNIKSMKLLLAPVIVALVMLATPSIAQRNVSAVFKNAQLSEAILDSIAANPAMLQKVNQKAHARGMGDMKSMGRIHDGTNMKGDTAMAGMMNDTARMHKMMDMMMERCEKDTAMCRSMCRRMMNNPQMTKMMQGMMNEKTDKMEHGQMKMNQ